VRVDVHTHAQPPEYLKLLLDSGRYEADHGPEGQLVLKERCSRFLTITPQMHDPEQRIAEMDAAGIDVQILSLTTPQVYFLEGQAAIDLARLCNDYLASIVDTYPTRFRALASIPFTADIDSVIAELSRCMDTLGMPGFVIGSNVEGQPIDDPRFDPFYEEANRRGAVMFVHPMVPTGIEAMNKYALAPLVGFVMDTTLAVSRLIFSDFFGRFLGINVLVGHLGGALPFLAGRLDAGYETYAECQTITRPPSEIIERLYLDTVSAHPAALRCAMELVGAERVLFGSDYPHLIGNVAGGIGMIENTVGRRDRGKVLGDNAANMFRLQPR
jgi:aminocarboxymuconate-semialdehyde decarboxylase